MSKFDSAYNKIYNLYENEILDADFKVYVKELVRQLFNIGFFEGAGDVDSDGTIVEPYSVEHAIAEHANEEKLKEASVVSLLSQFRGSGLTLKVKIFKNTDSEGNVSDAGFSKIEVLNMGERKKKTFESSPQVSESLFDDLVYYIDKLKEDQKIKDLEKEEESPVDELPSEEESALPQEGEESEEPPQELEEPPKSKK